MLEILRKMHAASPEGVEMHFPAEARLGAPAAFYFGV